MSDVATVISVQAREYLPAFVAVTCDGRIANSNNLTMIGKVIGLANVSTKAGFIAPVTECGAITNNSWNWTAGDVLYLNGTSVSKIAPSVGFSQAIGVAASPQTIAVNVAQPFLL